jgi:hypothetical protein
MIPTIVIRAAHDELDTRERFRSAGAVDYLLKPLQETPAKLVDKIVIVSPPNRVVVGEIAR